MQPLVAVTRSGYIESIHYGAICVVDADQKIVYRIGDPDMRIFFRSSAKPLQAISVLKTGAASYFKLDLKEIAIACGSHSGQIKHQETVQSILNKIGLNKDDLHCGTVYPYNINEIKRLIEQGLEPNPLHCNCSGKHAAILAACKYLGCSTGDYTSPENPVQRLICKTVSDFCNIKSDNIAAGTDGCSLPVFLLPMKNIAAGYSHIMKWAEDSGNPYQNECSTVIKAMTTYPDMISGDNEFCTELIQAAGGKLIAKLGAEGVYCVGIKDRNIGICIKISDGTEKAVYPAVVETLMQLGILTDDELKKLKKWHYPEVMNNLGKKVGNMLPVFSLKESQKNIEIGRPIRYLT